MRTIKKGPDAALSNGTTLEHPWRTPLAENEDVPNSIKMVIHLSSGPFVHQIPSQKLSSEQS